ncbi:hypothetical protein L1049_008820 [Liquidambar formosana]|uniref:DUF659 domain-containing protein n=1 Tax=Liquidambar formosana TaxID=63359 RepID=A0AAP0X5W9_LIQFO
MMQKLQATLRGTINRLKHHLAGTKHGIKACVEVPDEVKTECKQASSNFQEHKSKQNELLQEIGMGCGGRSDSGSSPFIEDQNVPGSGSGSGNHSSGRYFIQPKTALPFNTMNDRCWLPMVDGIAKYGPGFKPPSKHELRTWILKEEVEDINVMMEEHKKVWKQHGCSIMSDGWSDGKNSCLINFLVNSLVGTWFLRSVDASNAIKNGELMFNYLDRVVEEVGEENVIQIITNNATNYVCEGLNQRVSLSLFLSLHHSSPPSSKGIQRDLGLKKHDFFPLP